MAAAIVDSCHAHSHLLRPSDHFADRYQKDHEMEFWRSAPSPWRLAARVGTHFIAEPSREPAEPGAVLMAEQACPSSRGFTKGFGNAIRLDMGSAHQHLLVPLCCSDD
jgi:hypothetical protein